MRAKSTVALLVLTGCPDQAPEERAPLVPGCVQIQPERLDFGELDLTDNLGAAVTLLARCSDDRVADPVIIESIVFDEGAPSFVASAPSIASLRRGDSTSMLVTFRPTSLGVFEDNLRVTLRNADVEFVDIPIVGIGIGPFLEVTPETVDFGAPPIGCTVREPIVVGNTGSRDLVIATTSIPTGGFAIDAGGLEFPIALPPPDTDGHVSTVELGVLWRPTSARVQTGAVEFDTNERLRRRDLVQLSGGGTDLDTDCAD